MERKTLKVTKEDLEQMGNRVKDLLGISVDEKVKESGKTALEIIKEEFALLDVSYTLIVTMGTETRDAINDCREFYREISQERIMELLEYINHNGPWITEEEDIIGILELCLKSGHYKINELAAKIMKKYFISTVVLSCLEKINADDEDIVSKGYEDLTELKLSYADIAESKELAAKVHMLIGNIKKHLQTTQDKFIISYILDIINSLQNVYPEEFSKLDKIYAELLDDKRISSRDQDFHLYTITNMGAPLMKLLSLQTIEKIIKFCLRIAEKNHNNPDVGIWYKQDVLPAFCNIVKDERINSEPYKKYFEEE